MTDRSNGGTGEVLVDGATEWECYEALPPRIRRLLSEANAKFPSHVVLQNVRTLVQRKLDPVAIERELRTTFDEAAHQAHLTAGSLAPKATGPLVPRKRLRMR